MDHDAFVAENFGARRLSIKSQPCFQSNLWYGVVWFGTV